MKIVILADSLALPRPEGLGSTPHEATYPYLLDQSLRREMGSLAPQVIERGMRRRTIEDVLADWREMVEFRHPDILVVHVGIVDCAPRVFLRRESDFVASLRLVRLRKFILNFAHNHRRRIVTLRRRVYVPAHEFEVHVREVCERAQALGLKSLVFINIIRPPDDLEKRSPGFQLNVDIYNRILQSAAQNTGIHLVDLNRLVTNNDGTSTVLDDGIHLTEEGHRILARELKSHALSFIELEAPEPAPLTQLPKREDEHIESWNNWSRRHR
jgi:acyl-CoA thioesterase I